MELSDIHGKICRNCKVFKSLDEFNFKNKKNNKYQAQCKLCTRESIKKHYYSNQGYYLRKTKKRNMFMRRQIKQFIFLYLNNHPCMDCGEKDVIVLDFDHTRNKKMDISSMVRKRISLDEIRKEIKKCEVRCANCHRRKTAKQYNWYKTILKAEN